MTSAGGDFSKLIPVMVVLSHVGVLQIKQKHTANVNFIDRGFLRALSTLGASLWLRAVLVLELA